MKNLYDLTRFGPYLEADKEGGTGGEGEEKPVTFKTQAELDKLIEDRLKRDRAKAKKELEDEIRTKIADEAKEEEAKEQGNYKELLEKEQKKAERYEAKIKELEEGQKAEALAKVRTDVATKYGIPAALAERLLGETEAEIEADAKKVAKEANFQSSENGDTEARKGRKRSTPGGEEGESAEKKKNYVFTGPNDVSWAS